MTTVEATEHKISDSELQYLIDVTQHRPKYHRAFKELQSLRADASSQAEIERLKAALEPFADAADVFAREYPAMLDKPATSCGIRFDALQAARKALSGSKD